MITFFDLTPTMRTVFSALFFLSLCGGIYLISTIFRRWHSFSRILIPVFTLANGIMAILYLTEIHAGKQSKVTPQFVTDFCRLPLIVPILLLAGSIVFYICVLIRRRRYRKKYLTRSSIKEGIDKISSGLCFYHENGRIMLVNHRMYQLCHTIVGRDLQNAALFREILTKGEVVSGVTRLTDGFNPVFRLHDGFVWTFSQKEIGDIIQLSASDFTKLQEITDELQEKNVYLAALNKRLKKYGENVDKLTRARERLEVKARIHRDLGQALLASRRFLLSEEESHPETLKIWRDNIAMLRMEAKAKEDEAPMEMLSRMISATGVNCEFLENFLITGKRKSSSFTPQLKLGYAGSDEYYERELDVLRPVVAGETDSAIAEKLYISVATVKTHIQNMKNRTGFRNRTELAVKARESGLIIGAQRNEK